MRYSLRTLRVLEVLTVVLIVAVVAWGLHSYSASRNAGIRKSLERTRPQAAERIKAAELKAAEANP